MYSRRCSFLSLPSTRNDGVYSSTPQILLLRIVHPLHPSHLEAGISCIPGWPQIHYVFEDDSKLVILLPPRPEYWDCKSCAIRYVMRFWGWNPCEASLLPTKLHPWPSPSFCFKLNSCVGTFPRCGAAAVRGCPLSQS